MTAEEPFTQSREFDESLGAQVGTAPPKRSIRGLAWGVLRRPRPTLTEIAERGGRVWVVPILALAVTGTAAAVVMIPSSREAARQAAIAQFERSASVSDTSDPAEMEAQAATRDQTLNVMLRFTGAVTVVGSIAAPFIAVLVLTAVLHLIGTILGGQQSYRQMLAVISWARLPLVFQDVSRLLYGLTGGYDERMNGLAGLVPADHLAGPVLSEVSIWNLWTLALVAVSVGVVSHVSRSKALGAVVVVVLLRVMLGEVSVVAARMLSGFGG